MTAESSNEVWASDRQQLQTQSGRCVNKRLAASYLASTEEFFSLSFSNLRSLFNLFFFFLPLFLFFSSVLFFFVFFPSCLSSSIPYFFLSYILWFSSLISLLLHPFLYAFFTFFPSSSISIAYLFRLFCHSYLSFSSTLRSLINCNATVTSRLLAGTAWLIAKHYEIFRLQVEYSPIQTIISAYLPCKTCWKWCPGDSCVSSTNRNFCNQASLRYTPEDGATRSQLPLFSHSAHSSARGIHNLYTFISSCAVYRRVWDVPSCVQKCCKQVATRVLSDVNESFFSWQTSIIQSKCKMFLILTWCLLVSSYLTEQQQKFLKFNERVVNVIDL